jgi:hypothetical protein
MTTLLTTLRQRLADAEGDAERLRAAIRILERADDAASPPSPRRGARRTQPAAAYPTQPDRPSTTTEPPSTTAPPPASATTTGKPTARKQTALKQNTTPAVVPLQKLLKLVSENPGLTTTRLATHTGGDQSALLELLKESEQNGEVRREGQRRATSWYRVTDEDRVAARAAEIAAHTKSAHKTTTRPAAKRKVEPAG